MDDFWQLKGTNRPSSQWLHWPGLNQVDTGTGRYPNPYISQEVCVIERTIRQEPTFPNMLNLNSQSIHAKVGKPQAPYPLLAMLSENPQQFQSDFQQTAISRSSYLASNQSWYTGSSTNVTDAGGWPLMASGSLPFLGRAGALGTLGTISDFPQGAQGRDLNQLSRTGSAGKFDSAILRPGGLEMYKQALSVSSHLAEVELQPQYQVAPWQTDNKIQHVQSTQMEKHFPSMHRNVPQPVLEASIRLMNEQAYRKLHLRPRVFCASISGSLLGGELIVAETGRLGVMCSCHNWHMSVAKFSEHAGLFSINPGSAVLMEGGESLAQWRRTFFSQFGVKVLDDHVGWEWDESSGPEGDHAEHREVHGQSSHKETDSFSQGDCSILKNKPSWHSSIGLGNSNPSGSRTARMGLVQGNACRLGPQNLNDIEAMNLDRPYKGIAGNDFNVNQPFLQNSYDNTTKNQEANLTRLFWGAEVGASSVAEHVNFSKFGSHPFKPVTGKASAFNGKSLQKSAGLCSLSNPAQDLAQVEKDMLTSNFELRLGQPSQHNLSLGSAYSNSLQPRLSAGTITQAKQSSYERIGQTAWEQNTQQNVDHTILGRLATFGGAMGQSKEGIYATNWLRNDQRHGELCMSQINSERDILLGGSHQMQSCMFPDVHNAPSFPSLHKHAEDNDAAGMAGSFQSNITQQSLENRNNNEQRRAELSSLSYSTPLNAIRNDTLRDAGSDSQCHQQATLLIRPMVKNSDGIRNVKDLFSTPPERPIPVMGPPEIASSTSEPTMIKSSVIQTAAVRFGACESHLTSWTKLGSCIATSEGLSSCSPTQLQEHISDTMACPMVDEVGTHQGMLVPNNDGIVEEAAQCCLGPSTADACTTLVQENERSEDSENQGFNQQKDLSKMSHDPVAEFVRKKPPCIQTDSGSKCKDFTLRSHEHLVENATEQNQLQSVPNDESLVAEEKGSEGEMQNKACNYPSLHKTDSFGRVATRAFVRESKHKEVFPNDMIYKSCSTDKCCLSDEALMRSNVDAQADSAGVEAMTQESPSSFKCPSARHDKPPFNAGSENPKMEEKRSRSTICGRDDSGAKELIRNDVLDEGSGIGKCCSSIEADMEAMTSVGPVSSHAYAQVLESQTSIANSSSSNAVISDTLSNSVRVRKLFLEADKTARETQEVGQPNQKTDKKGRKALKWKCLEVTSLEGVGQGKFSRVEDKSAVVALRKALVSDSTCRIPTVKSLKRKRSLPTFGPDLKSLRFRTVFNEGIPLDLNDAEHIVKRKGPKPAAKPMEETSAKQVVKTNIFNAEKLTGRSKRIKYQDLTSPTCMAKASSSLKAGKEKVKNTTISGISSKTGRSTAERQDFKAVKMVSLSSILEFPKAGGGFKGKRGIDTQYDSFSKLLGASDTEIKARQTKGFPFGRTLSVLVHPKVSVNDHGLNRKEGRKRSLWEMAAKSMHHATDIPVAYAKDTKHIRFALRQSCQNKISASQMMVHVEKRAIAFRTSEFQGKMVSVPIKFIAEKRLATEDLQKETKGLLVDVVNHSNPSGRLVKRLRSQGAHAKLGSYGHILHSDSKGSMPTLEQHEVRQTKKRRKRKRRSKSFNARSKKKQPMTCCICGESSVKSNNVLVKCTHCGLAVHQACYGVTEVTKKSWICRPCKAHATNIVCVLCGYGEGAMTRAKKSEALAKGLLQAWQEEDDKKESTNLCSKSTALDAVLPSGSSTTGCECKNGQYDCKVHGMLKKDEGVSGIVQEEPKACRKEGLNAVNSVSSAVNDPKVTQWVHVVCALWMPGTRCVNVSTMAAFDVSGVPIARRKWVCSICKRPGGACIKCRVTKCATPFHPWCAHGKGLLQNEAFGGEEEKVGFFGRCLLHGQIADEGCEKAHIEGILPKAAGSKNDNSTCARTEGGYRRGDTSFEMKKTDSVSLGVSQEEVAAWLSIKEHKRSTRRFIKLANSDIKTHHREYVRYKQEQGWKRLAVYKSNIHALGLYTSDSIAKGEMVVEYVGEVIGLRVADKREADYLSSGRLQYRGACYLFRIDKEHIIDATHKGGIARFVNHSCSPNCVAKIICVEKQKKVVFFAEKNIAAGEELTYDYKLDFENDNRIPCYCKSAQCRGYLN